MTADEHDGPLRLSIDGVATFVMRPTDVSARDRDSTAEVRPLAPSPEARALGVRRFETTVEGWSFVVTTEPEARALLRERATQAEAARRHHGPVVVRAPMPGRIVRSWVVVGDTVEAGQRLLSIEAMKMENEVRAPRDGVVISITATAGSSVELGDELATVR
jgi:biotin carboxyl carrier protein